MWYNRQSEFIEGVDKTMKKKILTGAVTLFSVVALAACSQTAKDKDIVTMKGETITVSEFYDQVKNNGASQQVLLQMVIKQVFEEKYGKKVTDKEVEEAFEKMKSAYGSAFQNVLAQSGMTEDAYRDQIRANKLVEYAVKKAAEKELTDDNYKAFFETYTPEVTAQIIKVDSEEKAKEVLEKAKAEGADFAQLAKENSTDKDTKDKGGEVKFDSTSTTVADAVKKATFALEENGVSDVITVRGKQNYSASYYIVKLVKKTQKSAKWTDYKKQLKDGILTQKQNDASFIRSVISKELKEANLKVKDPAFQNVFAQYVEGDTSSSSSKEESKSQSSSSEEKKSQSSSSEEAKSGASSSEESKSEAAHTEENPAPAAE